LKSPHANMLVCLYCLGKGKACSLELLAEESCEADTDGDIKEAGTAEVMASMSAAVMVQTAEAPEVMEEDKGSIVKLSPVPEERTMGDHAEGMSRQLEQLQHELMEVTDYVSLAAEEAVARVLGESSDVQEVPGASATELEMVPRQG